MDVESGDEVVSSATESKALTEEVQTENQLLEDETNVSRESSTNLVIDENYVARSDDEALEVEEINDGESNHSKPKSNEDISKELKMDEDDCEKVDEKNVVKSPVMEAQPVEVSDDDDNENKDETKVSENKERIVAPLEEVPVIEIDDEDDTPHHIEHESVSPNDIQGESENPSNEESSDIHAAKSVDEINANNMKISKLIENTSEGKEDVGNIDEKEQAPSPSPIVENEEVFLEELPEPVREFTPLPEDGANGLEETDTIYTNKECINHECLRQHKQYFRVPQFAFNYYNVQKKRFKAQFICCICFDESVQFYEKFCNVLQSKQPLPVCDIGRQECIEIIDSSDEEDNETISKELKDDKYLNKNEIKLIEEELESSVKSVLNSIDIQNQLTWCKTILSTRLQRICDENKAVEKDIQMMQKKTDQISNSLYNANKFKIKQLPPLDLNSGRTYTLPNSVMPTLPPVGDIERPAIQLNETYYAVKNKAIASWVPCKVIETVDSGFGAQKNSKQYKIKFLKSQYSMLKTVSDKHMAYYEAPHVQLPIGTRVIAYFDATCLTRRKEKLTIQSAFYPGIIAEPLKLSNRFRYLIFYDDGYTQYVCHDDVRLVCHVAENVWEDVHPGSRDFIQKYLVDYAVNRPMVQTQKGQSMATESNGKWNFARVIDIDCSLILMQFEGAKSHTEWIYRGSMRLGPVYKEYQKSMKKETLPAPTPRLPRRTEPFIRYTEDEESSTNHQQQQQQRLQQQQQQQRLQQQQLQFERKGETRAVAKKSVSRRDSNTSSAPTNPPNLAPVRHLNNSTIYVEDENKPKGKVVFYTARRHLPPRTYRPHKCSPTCLYKITHNLSAYSLLSKPLLSGWERLFMRQKIKKVIVYRAPCGQILRNMKELHKYLRVTENVLNVDNFDFSPEIQCLAEYVIESAYVSNRDISEGEENMPIPLVNYYDNTMPQECKYSAKRIPTEGVHINLDENFLVGCDCEDGCANKEKCACWQLTYAGAKYGNPNTPKEEIGYQYRRLYEQVLTGIYECNSRCKCKSNCLNRVVQQPLQMKLQVFKTSNRGWGLRGLNDIPRGSFICIYAGHLLTESKANEGGLDAGDEYFAELDYIEVAEQIKEGYESDVVLEPEEDDDSFTSDRDDDYDFTPSKPYVTRSKKSNKSSNRNRNNQETDSQERQVINFNPKTDMGENSVRESSIRRLFGKDESCYIMDAKITGNLGRYFNHSCSPNLFVQNVLVDTHDLRFPWVAFFASTNIRAGTELTWNYNYEVGVVPGKVLYCECGAQNCRQRLL